MSRLYLVTSVIDVPDRALSYSKSRSVFSKEDRIAQTRNTIRSIRANDPGARVCLIEIGRGEHWEDLDFDIHIHAGASRAVSLCAESRYKGIGEIAGLLHAISKLSAHEEGPLAPDGLCKLSGRYALCEKAQAIVKEAGSSSQMIFKDDGYGYSTRYYFIPHGLIGLYARTLWLSIPFCLLNRSLEWTFRMLIPKRHVHAVSVLGVEGRVAVDGSIILE